MDSQRIRLKLGQFLFGSFDRVGYRLVKSNGLDESISEGSIIHLCRQSGRRDEQTFVHAFLPSEKLLTISCITPSTDSSGRPTSRNRTVIINTRDLEELVKPVLTEEFPLAPPKRLEQVTVEMEVTA